MKTTMIRWAAAVGLAVGLAVGAGHALAAGEEGGEHATPHYPLKKPERVDWSFAGPFGTFDRAQLQRGYKVYREVCASCHSMNLVRYRNLGEEGGPGFSEEQVKTLAAESTIMDGPGDDGEMFERPREPKDPFASPFPNVQAARAANGGAYPPDLSVMAKARHGGADYIYSLLTGYDAPPSYLTMTSTQHYNAYMAGDLTPFVPEGAHVPPGGFIAMPNPLAAGQVTYDDGTEASVDQMAKDVSAFIAWASEPHQVERKQAGFGVLIFLFLFAGVTYMSYRRIWAGVAH